MLLKRAIRLLAAGLVLAACESSPTNPGAEPDPTDEASLAAQTLSDLVQNQWAQLPSLDDLEEPARAQLNNPLLFDEADAMRSLALSAMTEGDMTLASSYALAADEAVVQATVAGSGSGLARSVVADVEAVFESLAAAIEGLRLSPETAATMNEIRGLLSEAQTHLAAGNDAAAVSDGLAAADRARDLSPKQHARLAIARAKAWFNRATRAAGPNPPDEIAEVLRHAGEHLEAAVRAFEAEKYRLAVRAARISAAHSRWVLRQLVDPPTTDQLEARARALIQSADGWLARAVEAAGSEPGEDIAKALRIAEEQLALAVRSFEAEEYKLAIRHAAQTIAIARRVLRALGD